MSKAAFDKIAEGLSEALEIARALECDEDEAAFDENLKRIAQARVPPKAKPGKGKATRKP